ncbi:hypothetical protein HaLaN_23362, partial [Haematococcus lacustris]
MPPKRGEAVEVPEPPPPTSGSGKFFYKSGATYKGDWILLFANPPPTPEVDGKKAVKKKDDPPPPPSEPPKRVRHGKGELQAQQVAHSLAITTANHNMSACSISQACTRKETMCMKGISSRGSGTRGNTTAPAATPGLMAGPMRASGRPTRCTAKAPTPTSTATIFQRLWPWPGEPAVRLCGPLGWPCKQHTWVATQCQLQSGPRCSWADPCSTSDQGTLIHPNPDQRYTAGKGGG